MYSSYNEIIPGIFIGDYYSSKNYSFLKNNNIKLIVNSTKEISNHFPSEFNYVNVDLYDSSSYNKKMYSCLDKIVNIMRLYNKYNKGILVHCAAGISRSSSIVAAYIIKYYSCNVQQAINIIRNKRPIAFYYGNKINFKESLVKFYHNLYNT